MVRAKANPVLLADYDGYCHAVADAYDEAPLLDEREVWRWEKLAAHVDKFYRRMTSHVEVRYVPGQPYDSAEQMRREVKRTGVLLISTDFNDHPLFTPRQNLRLRAVHDFIVHILPGEGGPDFSQKGEIRAYNLHRRLAPPDTWPALFTEVAAQACYNTVRGEFPVQKIAVLPFDPYNVGAEMMPTNARRSRKKKTSGRKRRVRRNPTHEMHAQPYDISATGWYFHDAEDFAKKYDKHLPVEEYSIEWIDGPEDDRLLFEALNVNPANLEQYFELVDELNEHDKVALYYLLRHRGMGPSEDLDDLLQMVEDEVRVFEGNDKEYVEEYIDSAGGVGDAFPKDVIERYFDYERFGRDIAYDMDPDDEGDADYLAMSDQERGEEYVDSIGFESLGKMAEQYFDVEAVARDMGYNGEIHEFDFNGQTYVTDFTG